MNKSAYKSLIQQKAKDLGFFFCGFSKADFLETYQFLNELPISYLHVFTYSERENTLALNIENSVAGSERAERSKMLHNLSEKKRRYFYESQLQKTATVLFEAEHKNGFIHGFTENYVKVKTNYDPVLVNELKTIELTEIDASDGLMQLTILN